MSFLLKLERYADQQEKWPTRGRHILSQYDDVSVIVYGTVIGRLRNTYRSGKEIADKDNKSQDAELTGAIATEHKASSSAETGMLI